MSLPSLNKVITYLLTYVGFRFGKSRDLCYLAETISSFRVAGVASVSVWFRSKKRPWKGIFGFDFARNETKTEKRKEGEGGGGRKETLVDKPLD